MNGHHEYVTATFANDDEPRECECVGDAVCCRCLGHVEADAECPCEPVAREPSGQEVDLDIDW